MPVELLPDNSPHVAPEKLASLARALKTMSWREAIASIWMNEEAPKKVELLIYVKEKYGKVGLFRKHWEDR